jgi:hypothetical protein
MAMVFPLATPVTGPATNAPPLMEMAVQFVPQVAVPPHREPVKVTVPLVITEFTDWLINEGNVIAPGVPPLVVVTDQTGEEATPATVTEAVVVVHSADEVVC